jgi:hypothetical protein
MNATVEKVWIAESRRLLLARVRFFESLSAIKELADFAITQVEEWDRKNRSIVFEISRKDIEGFTDEESSSAMSAVANLFRTLMSSADSFPPEYIDGDIDIDNVPEEIKKEVFTQLDKAFKEFEDAVPEGTGSAVIKGLVTTRRPRTRTDLLLSSLLIAAVSDFEVLFSAIATFYYGMRPESLRALDSKVSWREIETYASLDDLRTHFIEERVDSLMRDGYDGWVKWLEAQLKIKAEDTALNPHGMYEAFQRRHILVHNGGRVSPQYLAKVNWLNEPPEIGAELKVSREYLNSAIDELIAVGASLTHLLMRSLSPKSRREYVDSDAVMLTFELLKQRRWKLVDKIASIALPAMSQEYSRTSTKVNRWIALKRLAGSEAIAKEVAEWDVSALQPIFELSRLILLDHPSAVELARAMIGSGDLSQEQVETWPLFEDIRPVMLPGTS